MEIKTDPNRCGASGLCSRIAPDVFALDDDGVVQLRPGAAAATASDPAVAAAVEEAEIACPTGAIRIVRLAGQT